MHRRLSKVWVSKRRTKRLFLAIPLPRALSSRLSSYEESLKSLYVYPDYPIFWTEPKNYHITVRFIGNVDSDCIPSLSAVVRQTVSRKRAFALGFERMEIATPEDAKMIWARFKPSRAFDALVNITTESVAAFLYNECGGVVLKNGHAVLPHVTLARCKGRIRSDMLEPVNDLHLDFMVNTIVLNASETLPTGSVYTRLASFHLAKGDPT